MAIRYMKKKIHECGDWVEILPHRRLADHE